MKILTDLTFVNKAAELQKYNETKRFLSRFVTDFLSKRDAPPSRDREILESALISFDEEYSENPGQRLVKLAGRIAQKVGKEFDMSRKEVEAIFLQHYNMYFPTHLFLREASYQLLEVSFDEVPGGTYGDNFNEIVRLYPNSCWQEDGSYCESKRMFGHASGKKSIIFIFEAGKGTQWIKSDPKNFMDIRNWACGRIWKWESENAVTLGNCYELLNDKEYASHLMEFMTEYYLEMYPNRIENKWRYNTKRAKWLQKDGMYINHDTVTIGDLDDCPLSNYITSSVEICAECGHWNTSLFYGEDNNWNTYEGKHYCHYCFDSKFFACAECSETHRRGDEVIVNGLKYCRHCYDKIFSICDHCTRATRKDRLTSAEGMNLCQECFGKIFTIKKIEEYGRDKIKEKVYRYYFDAKGSCFLAVKVDIFKIITNKDNVSTSLSRKGNTVYLESTSYEYSEFIENFKYVFSHKPSLMYSALNFKL